MASRLRRSVVGGPGRLERCPYCGADPAGDLVRHFRASPVCDRAFERRMRLRRGGP
jgi:hypothetical protein